MCLCVYVFAFQFYSYVKTVLFCLNSCTFCSLTITSFYIAFCCFFFDSNNVYILIRLFLSLCISFMFFHLSIFLFLHRTGELITLCIFLLFTLMLKKIFFSVVRAAGYTFLFS